MSKLTKALVAKDCYDFKDAFVESLNKSATHIINPKTGRSILLTSAVILDIIKECKSSFDIDLADIKKLQSKHKSALKLSKTNVPAVPSTPVSNFANLNLNSKSSQSSSKSFSPPGAKVTSGPPSPGAKVTIRPAPHRPPSPGAKVTIRPASPTTSVATKPATVVSTKTLSLPIKKFNDRLKYNNKISILTESIYEKICVNKMQLTKNLFITDLIGENTYLTTDKKTVQFAIKFLEINDVTNKEVKINKEISNIALNNNNPHFLTVYKNLSCDYGNINEYPNLSKYHMVLYELVDGDINDIIGGTIIIYNNILKQCLFAILSFHMLYRNANIYPKKFLYKKITSGGYFVYTINDKEYYIENYGYLVLLSDFSVSDNKRDYTKDYITLLDNFSPIIKQRLDDIIKKLNETSSEYALWEYLLSDLFDNTHIYIPLNKKIIKTTIDIPIVDKNGKKVHKRDLRVPYLKDGFTENEPKLASLFGNDYLDKKEDNYNYENDNDILIRNEEYFKIFEKVLTHNIAKDDLEKFIKLLMRYKESCEKLHNKNEINFDREYIPHIELLNKLLSKYVKIIYDSYEFDTNSKGILSFYMFDKNTLDNTNNILNEIKNKPCLYIKQDPSINIPTSIPRYNTFQKINIPRNVLNTTDKYFVLYNTKFPLPNNNTYIIATSSEETYTVFHNSLLNNVLPFYYVINGSDIALSYNLMSDYDTYKANILSYNFGVKTRNIDLQKDTLMKELYRKALYNTTILPKYHRIHMVATSVDNKKIKDCLFTLSTVLDSFTNNNIDDYIIVKKSTKTVENEYQQFKNIFKNTNTTDKLLKNTFAVLKNNIYTYNYDYNNNDINKYFYNFGNDTPFLYISSLDTKTFFYNYEYLQTYDINDININLLANEYKISRHNGVHSKDLNYMLQFFINEKVPLDSSVKERLLFILNTILKAPFRNDSQGHTFVFHGTNEMLHAYNVDKQIYLKTFLSCSLNINTALIYSKGMGFKRNDVNNTLGIIYVIKIHGNSNYINLRDALLQILLLPGAKINILGYFFDKTNKYILCELDDSAVSKREQIEYLTNLKKAICVKKPFFFDIGKIGDLSSESYPKIIPYLENPKYNANVKTFDIITFNKEKYIVNLLTSSFTNYLPTVVIEEIKFFNLKYTIHQCFINDCYKALLIDNGDDYLIQYNLIFSKNTKYHAYVAYKYKNVYKENINRKEDFYINAMDFLIDCVFSNTGCVNYKNYYLNGNVKTVRKNFVGSGIYSVYGSAKSSFDIDIEPREHIDFLAALPYFCKILSQDGYDNMEKRVNYICKMIDAKLIDVVKNISKEYNTNIINKIKDSKEKNDIADMLNKLTSVLLYRINYYMVNIEKVKKEMLDILLEMKDKEAKVGGKMDTIRSKSLISYKPITSVTKSITKYRSNSSYQRPEILPVNSVNIYDADTYDIIPVKKEEYMSPISYGTSSHKEFLRISNELYERGSNSSKKYSKTANNRSGGT